MINTKYVPQVIWIPPKAMDQDTVWEAVYRDRDIHGLGLTPVRSLHEAKPLLMDDEFDAILLQTLVIPAVPNGRNKVAARSAGPNLYLRYHPGLHLLNLAKQRDLPVVVSSGAYHIPSIRRQVLASGVKSFYPNNILTRHLVTDLLEAIQGKHMPHEEYEGN